MASPFKTPSLNTASEMGIALPVAAEAAAPAGLSAPPSLESLWHALRRRWILALSLGLLAGLLGASIAWSMVPAQYTAQTLLQLSPAARHEGGEAEDSLLTYQRTQTALLKSFGVIQGTLERPNVADLAEVRDQSDPTQWLSKALLTDTLLGPEIIRISLSGDRSEDLALLLNELVHAYLKECAGREEGKIRARLKQLQENYYQCAAKLRERRYTLLTREEESGVDDPQTQQMRQSTTIQQLGGVHTQRIQLQLRRQETEVELASLRERVQNPESIIISDFAIIEDLKQDAVMKKHFDQLTQIEARLQESRRVAASGSLSADIKSNEKQRATLQRAMADYQKSVQAAVVSKLRSKQLAEARESIDKLERTLRFVKESERSLDNEIKRLDGLVSSLRGSGRPLDKSTSGIEALRDEVTQMELVVKKVGEEMGNLQSQLPASARVTQLEPAKPPIARKRDRQYKAAGAAGLGLFGLVFLGVGLLEFRHRRVYTSGDVTRGLGLNLLGTLPALSEPTRAAALAGAPAALLEQNILTEAVDGIRTQLLHAARQDARRVVMVTSAIAGEGKTSLAGQLATSLARGSRKTLLIDGDLRHPAVHRRFGLSVQPGLAEGLRGETPVEQLVQTTAVEGLSILTAGRCDRQAIQALAHDGARTILERLRADYEFIIIDVCPVLPVPDALLIGQYADAVLLAVLRNVSRLPAIYEAQRRLAALDIPMLGAVVLGEASDSYGVERYLAEMKQ